MPRRRAGRRTSGGAIGPPILAIAGHGDPQRARPAVPDHWKDAAGEPPRDRHGRDRRGRGLAGLAAARDLRRARARGGPARGPRPRRRAPPQRGPGRRRGRRGRRAVDRARADALAALADELGVGTFPTFDEGESILELARSTRRYPGTIPRLGPLVLPTSPWRACGSSAWPAGSRRTRRGDARAPRLDGNLRATG